MQDPKTLWLTKLAARLHDPAEKALVLLRDPAGHENGTSHALQRLSLDAALPVADIAPDNAEALVNIVFKHPLDKGIYALIKRADWWAAADRPQFPTEEVTTKKGESKVRAVVPEMQVTWTKKPELIHPLSGKVCPDDFMSLNGADMGDIKRRSFAHHSALLQALPAIDSADAARKALLTFWRFAGALQGETQDAGAMGVLWGLLPADTRIPDHSIWDHLDLTSAFAGAFAADDKAEAALLSLSIGPVQSFIATARSTSDLWAGSHLLSRLAWETMRPIVEALGPDAILFPRLRGIPQVDLWLQEQGLPKALFQQCEWQQGQTDANPLFDAALPNRLVAVVPAAQAQALAEQATQAVRVWLQATGETVVKALLKEVGIPCQADLPCFTQMRQQLAQFPEVYWAAVPFSLIRVSDVAEQGQLDTTALQAAMAKFYGGTPESLQGFLAGDAWKLLQKSLQWRDNTTFFTPNPGVLYPAVYELAERSLAAAKSTRSFTQNAQEGWRCSLSGTVEWLTTDRAQLQHPYRQQENTLWAKLTKVKPSWAQKGEHLGALAAIKRLWPDLFAQEVAAATGKDFSRLVVSSHTMTVAGQMQQWAERGALMVDGWQDTIDKLQDKAQAKLDKVALPRKLLQGLQGRSHAALQNARLMSAALELARECDDAPLQAEVEKLLHATLGSAPEKYYSLIMMDGDRMGAILAGDPGSKTRIKYIDSLHSQVRQGWSDKARGQELIEEYGEMLRAMTPHRHLAISGALNDFSQVVARHVIEVEHLGRLIYAGGDDVLAMLPVGDMLAAMQGLQCAYQGHDTRSFEDAQARKLQLSNGFALFKNGTQRRLMRMMGVAATSSCGAVVAHHRAPLAAVLRELRSAEQRAKNEGGRDAFSITVVKRAGGTLRLTAKWGEGRAVEALQATIAFLQHLASRRVVYNTMEWLRDLPWPKSEDQAQLLEQLLAYQLARQAEDAKGRALAPELAKKLRQLTEDQQTQAPERNSLLWLGDFLGVAEFLAREGRSHRAAQSATA